MIGRDCCKLCRHYQSEIITGEGEPMEDVAWCAAKRKMVESDDLCNDIKLSLWGAAYKNTTKGEQS